MSVYFKEGKKKKGKDMKESRLMSPIDLLSDVDLHIVMLKVKLSFGHKRMMVA